MISRELKSLDQLMDGALVERFNAALRQAMENVYDMRTDANKVRTINLVFKFKPNERRDAAEMTADVKVNIAPPMPLKQTVLMYQHDDGSVSLVERTEQIPGQIDMHGGEQPIPKVVDLRNPNKNM